MEDACERVGIVLNLTESQAQQLAEDVTIDAPPGCQQFLSCIAESVASEKSAPPKSLDEAAPDWKAEFDRICAQVPVAGSLTTDRLQQLIVDTNSLIAELQGSDIPQAKLFIRRLEMCRAFFEYSIELQAEASDSPTEG